MNRKYRSNEKSTINLEKEKVYHRTDRYDFFVLGALNFTIQIKKLPNHQTI